MDLSKAFYSMNHGLLIAKLHAYGLSIEAIELPFKQETKGNIKQYI